MMTVEAGVCKTPVSVRVQTLGGDVPFPIHVNNTQKTKINLWYTRFSVGWDPQLSLNLPLGLAFFSIMSYHITTT